MAAATRFCRGFGARYGFDFRELLKWIVAQADGLKLSVVLDVPITPRIDVGYCAGVLWYVTFCDFQNCRPGYGIERMYLVNPAPTVVSALKVGLRDRYMVNPSTVP